MANKVGIPIEAQIDTAAVEQRINSLGQKIAQANRTQFTPFSKSTLSDIDRVVRQFEQLKKINGDLRSRLNATGQSKASITDVDWEQLYPDQHSRARQMRKAFEYSTGRPFAPLPGQSPGEPPAPTPKPGPTWGGVATGVAQAGMRAAGPAGGVAANALGTGMSSGAGAGLMGLMGGMLALGVGKVVGSVMEKIDQAEANNIALDRLKRNLGDVNVSFNALKAVVHGGADNLKITYAEAGQLASQFVKLGNVTGEQYKTISDELGVGVGMSRAFGMDPSAGVGVMGQMRGIGVTSNTQESRRFALLIGETIGKSNAFAKSEEVMEALANYATSQTRNNMGAANVEGYAGMFSSMVGSGIPGLDPQGAGALLARINASLSAGGAKGEASQFFTGSIGSSMGLNPYQTRMLREGGAFATADGMFGEGSAYARYKGRTGPGGSTTMLQAAMDKLRGQYGDGSDELADATANHMGIGINQAMALLSLKPNEMGEMSKYAGDLTKLSGSGIGNLSKALYGSSADRQGLAGSLLGRSDVSTEDKARLRTAMGGSESEQKEVLAKLTAQYDQERTTGSDIRDSKNALDNIKTNLADKLVPLMNEVRHGIMYMAGGKDGKSPKEIMESVLRLEGADKTRGIKADFANQIQSAAGAPDAIRKDREAILADLRKNYNTMSTEERAQKQKRVQELTDQLTMAEQDAQRKVIELKERQKKALEEETRAMEERIKEMRKADTGAAGVAPASYGGSTTGDFARADRAGGGTKIGDAPSGGKPIDTTTLDGKLAEAERRTGLPPGTLKSVIKQETGGKQEYLDDPSKYHYGLNSEGRRVAGHTGKVSTAFGPFGILESTGKRPGYGVSPLQDKGIDEQIRFASEYLAARSRAAGSLEAGLAGYGEGSRYSRQVMSRIPKGGTPMPEGAGAGRGSVNPEYRVSADDITVRVVDANGKPMAPAQSIATRVSAAKPFGSSIQ